MLPRDPEEMHIAARLRAKPQHKEITPHVHSDGHYGAGSASADAEGGATVEGAGEGGEVVPNLSVMRSLTALKSAHASAVHLKDLATERAGSAARMAGEAAGEAATQAKSAASNLVNLVASKVSNTPRRHDFQPHVISLSLEEIEKKNKGQEASEEGGSEEILVASGALSALALVGIWCASGGTLVGLVLLIKRIVTTKGRNLTRRTHFKDSA